METVNPIHQALYIEERSGALNRMDLDLRGGIKRYKAWKNLSAFKSNDKLLRLRLEHLQKHKIGFLLQLSSKNPKAKKSIQTYWLSRAESFERIEIDIVDKFIENYQPLRIFAERGLIYPFINQIVGCLGQLEATLLQQTPNKNLTNKSTASATIEPFLEAHIERVEHLVRRATILELNLMRLRGKLQGKTPSSRYKNFVDNFRLREEREQFHQKYPVLLRLVADNLELWKVATAELLVRFENDRKLIEKTFSISTNDKIKSIILGGDTHKEGRSVTIITFASEKRIVYKPRDVSIEESFQNYIDFFNRNTSDVKLKKLKVLNKADYGWVEFVKPIPPKTGRESELLHKKIGMLLALVYSLNGVDIFFENLIVSSKNPVIIDLESMFFNSIDDNSTGTIKDTVTEFIRSSVLDIGVLPNPAVGASDDSVFDISVLGAKRNAQAPYTVPGLKNFGRDDMCMTAIAGWIPATQGTADDQIGSKELAHFVYVGLKLGLEFLLKHKCTIAGEVGTLDRCFKQCQRRLIIRDTKVYGGLQLDENHPDLLRNQIDRQWHWDNLWSELPKRPNLKHFIKSEIKQSLCGDIPYFYGPICENFVYGGDGEKIDTSKIESQTPIELAKIKIKNLDDFKVSEQLRLAATALGLAPITGLTHPNFASGISFLDRAERVGQYIHQRLKFSRGSAWFDTTVNPVPRASGSDCILTKPAELSFYEGTSGVAVFLADLGMRLNSKKFINAADMLFKGTLEESEANPENLSNSGFLGRASVIYAINRCLEKNIDFQKYDKQLSTEMKNIRATLDREVDIDLLSGIAGTGLAIIPYYRRTRSKVARSILVKIYSKLTRKATQITISRARVEGLDYLRGLSHGISGIALAIYRIGSELGKLNHQSLATELLQLEFDLTKDGKWTDGHSYNGKDLRAWCHGSPGIALTLASMPELLNHNIILRDYLKIAFHDTIQNGQYNSECLCHGTAGNQLVIDLILKKQLGQSIPDIDVLSNRDVLKNGFSSFGLAQTLSLGVMTGLAGAGFYLLAKDGVTDSLDFLTLE